MSLVLGCEGGEPVSPSHEAPAFAPADTDTKDVVTLDESFSVRCGGGVRLEGHLGGFVQFMGGEGGNLELNVVHLVFTFTNREGETFVFLDVGPDRVFVKDGQLFLTITGRANVVGTIGHVVIDLATGEAVLVAGKAIPALEELACEALT
jgi:hypothetical protein